MLRVERFLSLVLVTLGFLAHLPTLDNQFVEFDDPLYVTQNGHVRTGLTWENINWSWKLQFGFFHPLTLMSLQLDASLYGVNPQGFHITNLVLHLASVLILYIAFCRMSGSPWVSFFIAALMAVHPIHVESVAWISERKGLVSTFFWMIALERYSAYVKRPGSIRLGLVALAMILGLFAKPVLVTLPIALLLLDIWPLRRLSLAPLDRQQAKALLLEKVPLFVIALVFSLVASEAEHSFGSMASLKNRGLDVRLENSVVSYARYVEHYVYPVGLLPFYPHPGRSIPATTLIVCLIVDAVFLFLAYRLRYTAPHVSMGVLWYFVTLFPMIGLIQIGGHAMADRYAYIPALGLAVALVGTIAEFVQREGKGKGAVAIAAVVLGFLVMQTRSLASQWRDDDSLWSYTLRYSPTNWRAHFFLAKLRMEQQRNEEAIQHFQEGLKVFPDDPIANFYLASLLSEKKDPAAEGMWERVLELGTVNEDQVRQTLAESCVRNKHWEKAGKHFAILADRHPKEAEFHLQAGTCLCRTGQVDLGLKHLTTALNLDPKSATARVNMGVALCSLGRFDEAEKQFKEAVQDSKQRNTALSNLGRIAEEKGNKNAAIGYYRAILDTSPDDKYAAFRIAELTK